MAVLMFTLLLGAVFYTLHAGNKKKYGAWEFREKS